MLYNLDRAGFPTQLANSTDQALAKLTTCQSSDWTVLRLLCLWWKSVHWYTNKSIRYTPEWFKIYNISTMQVYIYKELSRTWWPICNYQIMMLILKLSDYDALTLPARSFCWHCIKQNSMSTLHWSGYDAQNSICLIIMQESELSLTQCQIIIPTLNMPDHKDYTATAKSWYLNWNCLIMIPSLHLPNYDVN